MPVLGILGLVSLGVAAILQMLTFSTGPSFGQRRLHRRVGQFAAVVAGLIAIACLLLALAGHAGP